MQNIYIHSLKLLSRLQAIRLTAGCMGDVFRMRVCVLTNYHGICACGKVSVMCKLTFDFITMYYRTTLQAVSDSSSSSNGGGFTVLFNPLSPTSASPRDPFRPPLHTSEKIFRITPELLQLTKKVRVNTFAKGPARAMSDELIYS